MYYIIIIQPEVTLRNSNYANNNGQNFVTLFLPIGVIHTNNGLNFVPSHGFLILAPSHLGPQSKNRDASRNDRLGPHQSTSGKNRHYRRMDIAPDPRTQYQWDHSSLVPSAFYFCSFLFRA